MIRIIARGSFTTAFVPVFFFPPFAIRYGTTNPEHKQCLWYSPHSLYEGQNGANQQERVRGRRAHSGHGSWNCVGSRERRRDSARIGAPPKDSRTGPAPAHSPH